MENWAKNIIRNYGSVGKIAFVNKEPVALTIHYPAWEDPLMRNMKRSLYLQCIYNPNPRYQRQGIGKALIKAVIQYAEKAAPYDYIVTHAFNTGEYIPQASFLQGLGFRRIPKGNEEDLYLQLHGSCEWYGEKLRTYWSSPFSEYRPVEEAGKAVIYYTPTCYISYVYASKTAGILKNILPPEYEITLINYWRKPEPYLRNGGHWLVVNAQAIEVTPTEKTRFREEVEKAVQSRV